MIDISIPPVVEGTGGYYVFQYPRVNKATWFGFEKSSLIDLSKSDRTRSRLPEDYLRSGKEFMGEKPVSHSITKANIVVDRFKIHPDDYNGDSVQTYYKRFSSDPNWVKGHNLPMSWIYVEPCAWGGTTAFLRDGDNFTVIYGKGDHSTWTGGFNPWWCRIDKFTLPLSRISPASNLVVDIETTYHSFSGGDRFGLPTMWDEPEAIFDSWARMLAHPGFRVESTSYTAYKQSLGTAWIRVVKKSGTATSAELSRKIRSLVNSNKRLDLPEIDSHGVLAGEAAASADANEANMIAFVKDLKDMKSLIPKLKNLAGLKSGSGEYLKTKYGILPTIDDLASIKDAFFKDHWFDANGLQVLTAGRSHSFVTESAVKVDMVRRCKLAVGNDDSRMGELARRLRDSGFYPSLTNLWDLVPYSFVLDWFVDVGSVLESIDNKTRVAQLPVRYATLSDKVTLDFSGLLDSVDEDARGTLSHVTYVRSVSPHAPRPPISFETGTTFQNHLLEGTALILQRTK